jgi:hypothetical protein
MYSLEAKNADHMSGTYANSQPHDNETHMELFKKKLYFNARHNLEYELFLKCTSMLEKNVMCINV